VYCTLGNAFHSLGNFSKAIEYHTEYLSDNGRGGGRRRLNLGNAYQVQGDFSKAIEYSIARSRAPGASPH
jgi:tetratricopeptide (TPR) repeat protein